MLSEGTVSYLAARSLGASGVDIWPDYECWLQHVSCSHERKHDRAARHLQHHRYPVRSALVRGAVHQGRVLHQSVAQLIGADALDVVLSDFYGANAGQAAAMQDLLDALEASVDPTTAAAIDGLATDWLRTLDCPVDPATLCL